MTTSATTTKQDEFFNSLYTPEEMEYHTLARAKDEILRIMDGDNIQWEIKQLNNGERILKMITNADFWSGTYLAEIEPICKSMNLTWWMSDCRVFNDEILPYTKVALNVAILPVIKNTYHYDNHN